jgi:hypothetical protein
LVKPVEIDFAAGTESRIPTESGEFSRAIMDDSMELEPLPVGPPTALRVTLQIAPHADEAAIQKGIYALLEALDDFERALGGKGIVVDAALSGGTDTTQIVALRPSEVRWSLNRFTQIAERLVGGPVSQTVEQPPVHLNGAHLAAVTALFAQRGPVEKQSARDRVQNWRAQQSWLAGLQVELFQPR